MSPTPLANPTPKPYPEPMRTITKVLITVIFATSTAWQDTWPTELYALESRSITPVNTIDGVLIQPQINISDLFTTTTTLKTTANQVSGGGGTNLNAVNFLTP